MHLQFKTQQFNKESAIEGVIKGYASIFGNVDSDGDVMDKGAFSKTLNESKERVKFLWQHRMDMPLGKVMDVYEDEKGLPFEAKISDTDLGKDAKTLIADGVLNEFSVGFMPIKMEKEMDGYNHIKEVKLYEFSLVTLAANDQAMLGEYKSMSTKEDVIESIDRIIRINGKLKSGEGKSIVEYELMKLKKEYSLLLKDEPSQRHSEDKEAEEVLKALSDLRIKLKLK